MALVTQLKIRRPDDFHVHLREGDILKGVLPYTARNFGRALVMPNLKHAVTSRERATLYENQILQLSQGYDWGVGFEPLMTIKLTQETVKSTIMLASSGGVTAVKLYPEGVTTNSENGVRDIEKIDDSAFKAMVEIGMPLCVHAEEPGVFSMDRENAYLTRVSQLARKFPKLKIVIEHASTSAAIKFVEDSGPNVAATITAHHLVLTLDDIVGDRLNPHNFCKPIAKRPQDRDALLAAAFSGNPKFFLGTDSAPHVSNTKECASGCAGCFTAPIAIELLATVFDQKGKLPMLEPFMSENGAKFYGLKPNEGTITLERSEWTIPAAYSVGGGEVVVPFMAGQKLAWKVV
jgi:dihydroorotase